MNLKIPYAMMKCAIIDDDPVSRSILEKYIGNTEFLELLYTFESAVDGLKSVKKIEEVDLLFLDVEMPEMSGLEFLGNLKVHPQVVIISAKEHYALDAFEYDVTDYLLKPISYARFVKCANKANERFKEEQSLSEHNDAIFIRKQSTLQKVKYEDIYWVEALENYVSLMTEDSKIIIHSTMKSIESKLPQKIFTRVHRSFIVNLNKFDVIEDNSIVVKIKEQTKIIPIGKSYKAQLLNDLNLLNI